jgi:hypothetical protein
VVHPALTENDGGVGEAIGGKRETECELRGRVGDTAPSNSETVGEEILFVVMYGAVADEA